MTPAEASVVDAVWTTCSATPAEPRISWITHYREAGLGG
jgi:hypothetical protein